MQYLVHQGSADIFLKAQRVNLQTMWFLTQLVNSAVVPQPQITRKQTELALSKYDFLFTKQTANLQAVVCRPLGYMCNATHFADRETRPSREK